jgi:hypothetical protein
MDGTGSGQCQVVGFGITEAETSVSYHSAGDKLICTTKKMEICKKIDIVGASFMQFFRS